MNQISVLAITQKNIISAGGLNQTLACSVAEAAIQAFADGKVLFPDKISQIFDDDTQDRTNCLPATVLSDKVSGVKWVSVFPSNVGRGMQNLSASILLSSTETGFPIAFMEGTICSNLRTAAVSTIAAKYLANPNPQTIGFVGAGQQARYHLLSMKNQFPSIKKCYVASRTKETECSFIAEMKKHFQDIAFIGCGNDYESVVRNSEILVSAISGQAPIIKSDWIQKGTFYAHVGGWEDEYAVPLKADKIVCDNWNSVKHRTQTLSRLYAAGKLTDDDIYCDLDALVSGAVPGRTAKDEFIYFNAVGLSYVDIALAYQIYCICREKNEGTYIELQSENVFDCEDWRRI